MKRFFAILVLGFCISTVQAQKIEKIKQVLAAQTQAWNAGNLSAFMQGYWQSDELLFVGKNGPQYGWAKTLANYQKSYPNVAAMGHLVFDIKEIRLIDARHAFVLGAWKLLREKDTPSGYFTLLFKKIKHRWVIVADHSS